MRRGRWRVLGGALIVVLAWLGIGGVGGRAIGELSSLQKNESSSFLPDDAESTRVATAAKQFSDQTTLPLLVVIESPQRLTAAEFGTAAQVAAGVPDLSVTIGGQHEKIADYLTAAKVPAIPSEDGKAALIVVPLNSDKASATVDGERPVGAIVAALRGELADKVTGDSLTSYVTGPAGFIADITKAFAGIDGLLLLVALGVVLVILLVVYRSPILPFAVLLTAVFGLSAAGFVVYRVADAGWITVSGQSQGILSILVVGAATDYALLLVSRYKEELHEHESTWVALRTAWRATWEPIAASAVTVILGLLALLLADLKGTSGLGPVGALGIVGALLAALTFLPALLVLGRRWIFWPAIPRVDHVHRADALATRKGWGRVAALVGRRPRATWALTGLALVIAAAFLPTLKADGVGQSDIFLTKVESVDGQKALARHFEGGAGNPLRVLAPEQDADRILDVLSKEKGVSAAAAISDTPATRPGSPAGPPKVVDGKVLIEATLAEAGDTTAGIDLAQRVRDDLHEINPQILLGGQAAEALDTKLAADRDLRVVGPTIIAVVFLVLCVLLRCLAAPLLLMLANILSFAATMGVSAVMFNHVFDFPGADPTTVLYGFVFLIALGVDYSIFLMSRAREESRRLGTKQGVLTALAVTGGVITSAGIVLAATFGALTVIPLLFLAQVAFIVAFGVLLDTLVVRSLLVPAIAVELGDRTWWPSRAIHKG